MGNLCGKSSKDDTLSAPGRPVNPAPPASAPSKKLSATVPARTQPSTAGRTLGGSEGSGNDPRAAAARAAEERAAKLQGAPKGALGAKLDVQRKQTQSAALAAAAEENRLAREADQATHSRNYN